MMLNLAPNCTLIDVVVQHARQKGFTDGDSLMLIVTTTKPYTEAHIGELVVHNADVVVIRTSDPVQSCRYINMAHVLSVTFEIHKKPAEEPVVVSAL